MYFVCSKYDVYYDLKKNKKGLLVKALKEKIEKNEAALGLGPDVDLSCLHVKDSLSDDIINNTQTDDDNKFAGF